MTRKEMNKDTTEYEKDLNELKEQILKEGNTLLTKRDLLERFCEIDKEYNSCPWNLLQILANINILIGQESCEDTISRAEAQTEIEMNASRYTISKERGGMGQVEWSDQLIKVSDAVDIIRHLSSATPKPECSCEQIKWERDMAIAQLNKLGYGLGEKPRTAHWILLDECSNGGYYCSECRKKVGKEGWSNTVKKIKYCPNCGAKMVEVES